MRLVTISDTHNRHKRLTSRATFSNSLPDGDLLLHAGDFTGVGRKGEVESFVDWLTQQASRFTYGAIFIAGNHDKSFDTKYFREYENFDLWDDTSHLKKPTWLHNILSDFELGISRIAYLENQQITVGNLKIWGSPVTPWFRGDHWAFNKYRGPEIAEVWNEIPLDTDVIITHGPVAYKLDYVPQSQEYVGCEDLRKTVEKINPLLHISGHIHEGYGVQRSTKTLYVNASICNHSYEPVNKPVVIEVDIENRNTTVIEVES